METIWNIANIKRIPSTGLVIEVTYIMKFKKKEVSDRKVGMVTLEGDPSSQDFIPFDELTEEIVLGWVQSAVGTDSINKIKQDFESRLDEKIQRIENPEFIDGLPWSR